MAQTFTDRQVSILTQLGKLMGFNVADVTSATLQADVPISVTYANSTGTFNRSTQEYLGGIISDSEYQGMLSDRQTNQINILDALSDVAIGSGLVNRTVLNAVNTALDVADTIVDIFDPSLARLAAAGLPFGAEYAEDTSDTTILFSVNGERQADDIRVKISDPTGIFVSSAGVMNPLNTTNAVIFPYTPTITVSHQAHYSEENLTHSNYGYPFFQSSSISSIAISGRFTAQNSIEAAYVIAVQHFFRSVTKMFYGTDAQAGAPPPVLRLSGHGQYQFKNVPIVIKNYSTSLPPDVDYISTSVINGEATRVPTVQDITIECMPVYSRRSISQDFGLNDFALGNLNTKGFI